MTTNRSEGLAVLKAAEGLAKSWPISAMVSPATGLPVCIETTKHVVAAFRRLGVRDVRPLPVAFYAWNLPASLQSIDGQEREGACLVKLEPGPKQRGAKGWPGHLVVDHPEFLLDLVLPATISSTGAVGFDDVEAFCGEKGNTLVDVGGAWMAMSDSGVTLRFDPMPEVASWRNTEAWRSASEPGLVEFLAERLERFGA